MILRFYDPGTLLAGAGLAAGAAGTFLDIRSNLQQGRAAADASVMEAMDLRAQQADIEIETGRAIRDEERRTEVALSRARAVAWAQGWGGDVNAQALQEAIIKESEIRKGRARQDALATRDRLGLRERRVLAAGRAARRQGRQAAIGAGISGAASLLRGGASLYGRS